MIMAKDIYGLIGFPVKHSLSPAMQNAAFSKAGMDAEYRLFEIEPSGLEEYLNSVKRCGGIAGLNVTIPHKIKVKEYLERNGSLDQNAVRLGAVNTIKISGDGSLRGFNTDGPGFYRSLVEDLKFEPEGKDILVLGSGGAAKAVIMYLGNAPRTISVFDLDTAKTAELKDHYAKYFNAEKLKALSEKNDITGAIKGADLLINATPVGMKDGDPSPVPKGSLKSGMYIYDLVYNRPYTQLVKDAASVKAHAVAGSGMLLYQGAAAFEIWTDKTAPVDVMRRALNEALKAAGE